MRKFLIISALTFLQVAVYGQDLKKYDILAHMFGEMELYDGHKIDIWGFMYTDSAANPEAANQLPSPVIEFTEGDSIIMTVDNASGLPHTIHLHGMDVGQANDGVPCTSFAIEGYNDAEYRIKVKHAGTFLYHCHFETHIHLQMGMYGAVIVRPEGMPKAVYDAETKFTKEYVWLGSEIDADWHVGELRNGQQPGYDPNYFLINGKEKHQIKADTNTSVSAIAGDTVLLRLANMGYGINRFILPQEMNATIIGSDGRRFDQYEKTDTIYVYPGERYAVFVQTEDELMDSVKLEYLDNYKNKLWGVNYIPVSFEKIPLSITKGNFDFKYQINESSIDLSFPSSASRHAALFDLSGRLISESYSTSDALSLNRDSKPGVFIIRVYDKKGSAAKKIMVR